MDTINGLPLHPLLVHLVVVLVPLTALMAIAGVVWPAARRRLGILTPLVALGTLVAVPLTTSAGESLEEQVPASAAVERHAGLGDQLIYWVGPLFALTVLWWAVHDDRLLTAVRTRVSRTTIPTSRPVAIALGALLVVVSVVSVIMVYRIGESGARAVWT